MSELLLIKGGSVVTESGVIESDLLIENGIIKKLSKNIESKECKVIDAKECFVLPGGIDVHTHMELPVKDGFSDDTFSTGTKAALLGGTTTIIDFANQKRGSTLLEAYDKWRKKADHFVNCDYGLHISVTSVTDDTLAEIDLLVKSGVTSFKTFSAYEQMRISSDDLRRVMLKVKEVGGIVTHHAENGEILSNALEKIVASGDLTLKNHPIAHPVQAEVDAIKTLAKLSKETGCPVYVVHLSSKEGLKEVIKAKREGVKLFAESCPQYLAYNDEVYSSPDFSYSSKYVLSPPLRDKDSNEALWEGFLNGEIDVLATDHCPFSLKQRRVGEKDFRLIPNGMSGVGERMEYFYNEGVIKRGLSIEQYVKITSTNPARIFGLYPEKGTIKVGSDSDILIVKKKSTFKVKVYHRNEGKYISRELPDFTLN